MPHPRLADRYAKSLIDLSEEQDQLENVYADMKFLQSICKQSPEFVNLLRSPIIRADKKDSIIQALTRDRIGELTHAFTKLLVSKGRESDMPEIINAFIEQYNEIKDIHTVKLTTAIPVSDELKNAIVQKVKTEADFGTVQLEAKVDPALIGGFVLEYNNNLVDASVLRDLKDIQKQFYGNVFEHNIR